MVTHPPAQTDENGLYTFGSTVQFCERFEAADGAIAVDYVFYRVESSTVSSDRKIKGFYTLLMVEPAPENGIRQKLVGVPHNSIV